MDVCTLTIVSAMIACVPSQHCDIDRGVKYCDYVKQDCKTPDPIYQCVRSDGTKYTRPLMDHPTFIEPVNGGTPGVGLLETK